MHDETYEGRHRRDRGPRSARTLRTVLACAYLWVVGAVFLSAVFIGADPSDADFVSETVLYGSLALICLIAPVLGFTIRNRPEAIRCPRTAVFEGASAIHFPADRMAHPTSEVLYGLGAATFVGAAGTVADGSFGPHLWPFLLPAALMISYPVFSIAGRFAEDGTYLTERGVSIRARGLRAEIPWSSVAGSRTYRTWPFPYDRIAIDLHPGSPREVAVTVPWWIGSPVPLRDTVILTKVQVPGLKIGWEETNPGKWIDLFARLPPTDEYLAALDDPPSYREAQVRLWDHLGPSHLSDH